jgi:hypothetical protein
MDNVLTPVISISLGLSAVFAVMPNNRESPEFFDNMCQGWSTQWSTAKKHIKGRLAFLLHHGDILLMTGQFQKSFQHKTWKRDDGVCRSLVELTQKADKNNYSLILSENDQNRLDKQDFNINKRYVITGRHTHYHDKGGGCPLMRLPRDQHERLTIVDPQNTMIGTSHDSLLPSIPAFASSSKDKDVRNKIATPKAKSPPICLKQKEIVEIMYMHRTRPAYDETSDKAGDSDSDVPMTPDNVFEKTPSSDMSMMDARNRLQDLVEIHEIPIISRATELKYCRINQPRVTQASKTTEQTTTSTNQHRAQHQKPGGRALRGPTTRWKSSSPRQSCSMCRSHP